MSDDFDYEAIKQISEFTEATTLIAKAGDIIADGASAESVLKSFAVQTANGCMSVAFRKDDGTLELQSDRWKGASVAYASGAEAVALAEVCKGSKNPATIYAEQFWRDKAKELSH